MFAARSCVQPVVKQTAEEVSSATSVWCVEGSRQDVKMYRLAVEPAVGP